ncbi:MAG: hypothetical protein M1308_17460, partial [Actinobacteria bacterium]|nr:hypothetical protein [Actinomycetota bacterium]
VVEKSLRQGLILVDGNIVQMIQRPVVAVFLAIIVFIILFQTYRYFYNKRKIITVPKEPVR